MKNIPLTELGRTAPERIWLQIGDDDFSAEPFPYGEEITWCQDSVVESEVEYVRADLAATGKQQVGEVHPDDAAVDAFAVAMKAKMAAARAKGRGGWEDPAQCSSEDLSRMLRDHVEKGDPLDVANFCMMLHQRREAIAAPQQGGQVPVGYLFTDDPDVYAMPGSGFHSGKEPPADAINVVPVYADPATQGIDLGQLPVVARLYERNTGRCTYRRASVTRAEGEPLVRLADVRALIDGRDAGTGVGSGKVLETLGGVYRGYRVALIEGLPGVDNPRVVCHWNLPNGTILRAEIPTIAKVKPPENLVTELGGDGE